MAFTRRFPDPMKLVFLACNARLGRNIWDAVPLAPLVYLAELGNGVTGKLARIV